MAIEGTRGNKHDAANKLESAKDSLYGISQNAKEAFSSLKEAASSFGSEVTHDVQEQTKKLQDKTEHFIKTKPYTAVGIAVLSGMVLSWLLRSKD